MGSPKIFDHFSVQKNGKLHFCYMKKFGIPIFFFFLQFLIPIFKVKIQAWEFPNF